MHRKALVLLAALVSLSLGPFLPVARADVPQPWSLHDVAGFMADWRAAHAGGGGLEGDLNGDLTVDWRDAQVALDRVLTPMSEDARESIIEAAAAKYDGLPADDPEARAAQMVTYLRAQVGIEAAGSADGLSVWARFKDGVPLLFLYVPPDPTTSSSRTVRPSRAAEAGALRQALERVRPAASGPGLPAGKNALILDALAEATGVTDEIAAMLGANGYTVRTEGGSLSAFGLAQSAFAPGVVYVRGHGGLWADGDGAPHASITTSTPCPTPWTDDDWKHQRETMYGTWGKGNIGITHTEDGWFWGISDLLIRNYWQAFPASSLVFFNGCSTGATIDKDHPTSSFTPPFASACFTKQASLFLGWDSPVNKYQSGKTARFLYRRLVQIEPTWDPSDPDVVGSLPKRPVDWTTLVGELAATGYDWTYCLPLDIAHLEAFPNLSVSQGFQALAPSINDEDNKPELDFVKGTIALHGAFGSQKGKVLLDGRELEVTDGDWTSEAITAKWDCRKGDVQVDVDGRKSNKVTIRGIDKITIVPSPIRLPLIGDAVSVAASVTDTDGGTVIFPETRFHWQALAPASAAAPADVSAAVAPEYGNPVTVTRMADGEARVRVALTDLNDPDTGQPLYFATAPVVAELPTLVIRPEGSGTKQYDVYVDGAYLGRTSAGVDNPFDLSALTSGTHSVRIRMTPPFELGNLCFYGAFLHGGLQFDDGTTEKHGLLQWLHPEDTYQFIVP